MRTSSQERVTCANFLTLFVDFLTKSDLFMHKVIFLLHTVVEPGEKAWNEIHQEFGDDVFKDNGELDREALGKVIFSNSSKRVSLNKITHPKIERMIHWQIIKYFFEGKFELDFNHFFISDLVIFHIRSSVCGIGYTLAI